MSLNAFIVKECISQCMEVGLLYFVLHGDFGTIHCMIDIPKYNREEILDFLWHWRIVQFVATEDGLATSSFLCFKNRCFQQGDILRVDSKCVSITLIHNSCNKSIVINILIVLIKWPGSWLCSWLLL